MTLKDSQNCLWRHSLVVFSLPIYLSSPFLPSSLSHCLSFSLSFLFFSFLFSSVTSSLSLSASLPLSLSASLPPPAPSLSETTPSPFPDSLTVASMRRRVWSHRKDNVPIFWRHSRAKKRSKSLDRYHSRRSHVVSSPGFCRKRPLPPPSSWASGRSHPLHTGQAAAPIPFILGKRPLPSPSSWVLKISPLPKPLTLNP